MVRKARGAPLFLSAAITSLWTALLGFVPLVAVALLAWAAETRSSAPASEVVRFSLDMWLFAHGVPLHIGDGVTIGLVPLAWSAVIAWQLFRAGQAAARAVGAKTFVDVLPVAGMLAVLYGSICSVAAFYGRMESLHVSWWLAFLICAACAFVVGGCGALRLTQQDRRWWQWAPLWLREGIRAGAGAAAFLMAAGALAAGVALVLSAEQTRSLLAVGNPGAVGGFALFAACILFAPTVALWGTAYLVGPGFALGEGTSVNPWEVTVGPLPAFPLLGPVGHVPSGKPAFLLFLVPLVVGVVVGALLARRTSALTWYWSLAGVGVAAVFAGLCVGLAAGAGSGPLGAERLVAVGPSAWRVGVAVMAEVAVVGAVALGVALMLLKIDRKLETSSKEVPTPREEVGPALVVEDIPIENPHNSLGDSPEAGRNPQSGSQSSQ